MQAAIFQQTITRSKYILYLEIAELEERVTTLKVGGWWSAHQPNI